MTRRGTGGGLFYDNIVCSHSLSETLVVERGDDGQWTERIVESSAAQVAPGSQARRLPDSTPRAAPTSPFLRTEEAAAYTRCGKKRLLDWARRGILRQTVDPDGRRFFHVDDLDSVMGMGATARAAIASNVANRSQRSNARGSWLRPTQPRTQPKDKEVR